MNTGPVSHTPKVFDWADYTEKLNKIHQFAEVLKFDYSIRRNEKTTPLSDHDGFQWYVHGTKVDHPDLQFCTQSHRDLNKVLDDALEEFERITAQFTVQLVQQLKTPRKET